MKCANRHCNSSALYFRSGSLHAIDCITAGEQIEDEPALRQRVIWLCAKCSRLFTVDPWRPPGQQLQARKQQPRQVSNRLEGIHSSAA